jgi:PAS domain S-box-containing protein
MRELSAAGQVYQSCGQKTTVPAGRLRRVSRASVFCPENTGVNAYKEEFVVTPTIDENLLNSLIQGVKDYAIYALDPGGRIITWNEGAERIKGYTSGEVLGQHFSLFYTDEAKATRHAEAELAAALKDGSYEEQGWRVRKNGTRFWADVVITPLFNREGQHIGFAKVTRDLTERQKAREFSEENSAALRQSELIFNSMVAAVKDYAIFVLSPAGLIRTWNSGAERIKGYSADEVVGKSFSIFYTDEARAIDHPGYELEQAAKNGSYEEEGWRIKKDGGKFWASVTITAIPGKDGPAGFVKVTRDLTERKRNEEALKESRDEAILANQLKSRFVANVTHEIRTPLTSIVGLSEILTTTEDIDPEVRETSELIFISSKHLLQILNDLLDFAKLESGKASIESVSFSIAELFDQIHAFTKQKAADKGLAFKVHLDNALPKNTCGDPTKIRQILLNLISNAIKFTEHGGLELSAQLEENSIVYSVTDTGIGISEDEQTRLFQPFVQALDSTTRLYGGTGLGLSISGQYVELMKGRIGISSTPGKGTTVWFSLPLSGG